MNPRQLALMIHYATGRVLIVLRKPKSTPVLKDVTADFALMLAAEIMANSGTGMVNTYEARDPAGNVLEIEVTARIVSERKGDG